MNANIEDRGIKGDCTPLMEASSAGHVDIVSLLIAHGADVNAHSTSGKLIHSYFYSNFIFNVIFLKECIYVLYMICNIIII